MNPAGGFQSFEEMEVIQFENLEDTGEEYIALQI